MSQNDKPFVMNAKPGRYVWCSCGESKNQPFCDGAHGPTGMRPMFIEITAEGQVAWCGCKTTSTKPFCDGSHKKFS